MEFLADENIEWPIIVQMRKWGCDVATVRELMPGANDDSVLQLAARDKRVLLTNDSDFGGMIFSQMKGSYGVVLMRFSHDSSEEKIKIIRHLLKFHEKKLKNHFTVISEKQIRIRPFV